MNTDESASWYDSTKEHARLLFMSVKVLTKAKRFPSCKCFSFCNVLQFKSYAIDKKSDNEKVEKIDKISRILRSVIHLIHKPEKNIM
jgi:hypothetical protein